MKLTSWQRVQLRWASDPDARRRGGFWWTLLWYAVLFVASELLRPKPKLENAKPKGLGDFNFPTATEGRVVPLLWGTVQITGPNVVWYGDLRQTAITEKVKTGMISSDTITKGYRYSVGTQFALCRGEVDELLRVWIGDDEVFSGTVTDNTTFEINKPNLFGGDDLGNGGFVGTFRFHAGSSSQAADTYLSNFQAEGGVTPAYRGTSYICPDVDPIYVGNSTSIKQMKFEVRRMPNGLSLSAAENELNSGNDVNPMSVVYEVMTDTDWGLGYAAAEIDTSNFVLAAQTLAAENNGVSILFDSPLEAGEIVRTVEEQIDGVIFFNQSVGKWQVKLARADYTVGALDPLDETNSILKSYSRGSWENTTNIVRVEFNSRSDNYKQTYGLAQDTANIRIQDDVNVSSTRSYPGVKNATLANTLAWRELRTVSYPLAKAKVEVDRSFWDVTPAEVFRFTNEYLGITDLAMRVTKIDYGELENNKITLDLVQDVFYSAAPSFGDPTDSGWTDPSLGLDDMNLQIVFEAPRAIVRRDPSDGSLLNKIYAAGNQPGVAGLFEIRQRNASGTPAGDYAEDGIVTQFCKVGELLAGLNVGSAYPLSTLVITPTPDTQEDLLAAINEATIGELGVTLTNLFYIDDGAGDGEFILVRSAEDSGANVQLNNVYRGALDTVQQNHSAGADVYLISSGGGISRTDIDETNNVDVKLIPVNLGGDLSEGSATTTSFQMDKRIRRPYPPSELTINAVVWDTTAVSLEANGAGAETYYVNHDFDRRNFEIADNGDEISQLGVDNPTTTSGYNQDHDIVVTHDPAGTNDAIESVTVAAGNYQLDRITILQALDGAVPTGDIRVSISASHTDNAEVLTSRQALVHDYAISTALSGQFEFGLLSQAETSALYTATAAGTYAFTLSSATTVGAIEYRLNGGSWTSLIAAGLTTGNIAGVVGTDTIEVRHQSTDVGLLKQLDMNAPGAGQNGFAILEN